MAPDLSGVIRFYEAFDEPDRLARGRHRLEAARLREMVAERLPGPPATILDVGGAGGAHSAWLADAGYDVYLVDPVPMHVKRAELLASTLSRSFSAAVGDASDLPFGDASIDAVLLFGPLYHLPERQDRIRAWLEASRVLRDGGVAFGVVISEFAGALDMIFRPPDKPTPGFVPAGYFHTRSEARAEAEEAGLRFESILGVEGPGWLLADFDARWDVEVERKALFDAARAWSSQEDLMGIHSHWLVTATKTGASGGSP